MPNLFDLVTDETIYLYKELNEASTDIFTLPGLSKLFVRIEDEFIVSFFCGNCMSGDVDDPQDYDMYDVIFHGYGFSGSLRECRHTYWGEPGNNGYIFSPNAETISSALSILKKWFDME